MEIPGKYLAIIGVMVIVGLVGTGYLYAPTEVVEERPLKDEYIGTFAGQCMGVLNDTINISGGYNGGITGKYFGKIFYEGEEVYANATLTNTTFNGTIYGKYINSTFIGEINGRGRGFLEGTLIKTVKKGFSIPNEFWYYLGGLIIFIILHQIGVIDQILQAVFNRDIIGQGGYITEPDSEIYEKLKQHINNLTGEYPTGIRDVLHDPPKRTTEVIFYVFYETTELMKVSYKGKNKFTLPIMTNEGEYQKDKIEYVKRTLLREQQQKMMDELQSRERSRAEFERRKPQRNPQGQPPEQDYL